MADDLPAPFDPPKECCIFVPGHPNLLPGWACGACQESGPRTYNGLQRTFCKKCGHKRCPAGGGFRNLAGDEPIH
ncbi:MAG: hypothetical protein Q7R30_22425 [Acidobacteriota bacterium]|nr:hypothetical protein [Acidobacteriota bacterium]